jgi:hypothetical protein
VSILNVKKSKTGRPSVDSEAVTVRLERHRIVALDEWRRQQDDLPTRPEAIRRLLEVSLNSLVKPLTKS